MVCPCTKIWFHYQKGIVMPQVEASGRIQAYQNIQPQTQGSITGSTIGSAKTAVENPLADLQKGEVIEGKVLSAGEKSITLEIDGQPVEAKLDGQFEFVKGEMVRLVVADSTQEKLLLKPELGTEAMSNKRLEDILQQLQLKLTPENKALVQELMGAKLPLSQDNLRSLQLMMNKFPEVDLKSMVLLLKNGMELNSETVQQMMKAQLPEEALTARLEDLVSKLTKMAANQKSDALLSEFVKGQPEAEQLTEQLKLLWGGEENKASSFLTNRSLSQLLGKAEMDGLVKDIENWQKDLPQLNTKPSESASKLISLLSSAVAAEGEEIKNTLADMKQLLTQGELKDVRQFLTLAKSLPEELQNQLKQVFSERISAAALRRAIFLSGQEKDPAEHLEKLYTKLNQLKGGETPSALMKEAAQDALSARSSLGFMAKFQDAAGFMQLPFLFGDKVLNGALFVLNNKKKEKDGTKDDVSALLQLDFATLGHLDTFIRKENQKVQIDFYAEDSTKEKWLKEKLYLLHNSLLDKSYQVAAIQTFVKKDKINGFSDFLANEQVKKVSRFSFDMRA